MSDWIKVAKLPKESPDLEAEMQKWIYVAEDMALIPENNVRSTDESDQITIEVSRELYDCMRGI